MSRKTFQNRPAITSFGQMFIEYSENSIVECKKKKLLFFLQNSLTFLY